MSLGVLLLASLLAVPGAGPPKKKAKKAAAGAVEQPWQWSLDKVKRITHRVRAGKDLTPKAWPGGARVAVALSFDLDNESPRLRDNQTSPAGIAQGEYGSRAGLPRILKLLAKHRIKASFFTPAVIAQLYPASIKAVLAGGHELGMHGWIHERNSKLTLDQERALMKKAFDVLTMIAGKKPVGIRTPSWDFSPHTLGLIEELGLLYDSSLMADDRPYQLVHQGKPTSIVELPVEWILDDYPYFGFSRYKAIRPQLTPSQVLEIWKAEFDVAWQERTLLVLTMHPHIIGHRSRMVMLDELIRYMKARGGVWFATHEQVAREAHKVLKGSR